MDTFYSILDEEESKQIWDRINAELRFQPSVRVDQLPFQLSEPYLVLDLTYATQEQVEKLLAEVPGALAACLGEDDWIYALDWHHSYFRYDPRLPITEHSHWVEDESYMGGGYDAWFPDFYPDGDYYFFVQRDLKWGWLGHPWRREIWLFGAPLIGALSPKLEELGFPVKDTSKKE